jgi:hypothetical protein
MRFTLTASDNATFAGIEHTTFRDKIFPVNFKAGFPLFLIREAWNRGTSFEDLADGFGAGLGTCGGDWSGIRDSSPSAKTAMLERALNALFPAVDS